MKINKVSETRFKFLLKSEKSLFLPIEKLSLKEFLFKVFFISINDRIKIFLILILKFIF